MSEKQFESILNQGHLYQNLLLNFLKDPDPSPEEINGIKRISHDFRFDILPSISDVGLNNSFRALLDEVDKMTNREHSPFSTLHQLLEPENSSTIFDEFLELEFNASFIIYILTANDAKNIPESLLSRMNVFEIKNPDQEQMKIISQNIFIELLAESKMFKPKLSDNMLTSLIDKSPRDVFQILSRNLFNLSAEQKKKTNNDFSLIQQDKKEVKFGF